MLCLLRREPCGDVPSFRQGRSRLTTIHPSSPRFLQELRPRSYRIALCCPCLKWNTQDQVKSIQNQCQQPWDLNMRNYRLFILFFLGLVSLALVQTSKAVGFICDGQTPQDVAINSALAAGGEVRLPAGVCIISNTLNIPNHSNGVSKATLRGAGFTTTTIQVSSNFTASQMISVNGTTTITDLTLNGQAKNTWGIRNVTPTSNIPSIFKNLSFVSLAGTGGGYINEGAGAVYNISDSFFNSTNIAIYNANWGTSSIISRNNVLGGQGFLITNSGLSNEGIIVDGNQIISSGGGGTIKFEKCLQCVVSNNIVDDLGAPPGPYSLNITGGTLYKVTNNWFGRGANVTNSRDLFFSGNTFPGGSPAIFNLVTNVQFADNVLQNPNCVENCTGQSLFILGSANIQVHHNNFQDAKGAIYAGGNTRLLVEGNIFSATCDRSGPMTFVFNSGGTNCGNSLTYPTTW